MKVMSFSFCVLTLALALLITPAMAQITISPMTCYHNRTDAGYDDSASTVDDGGMLFFYVANQNASSTDAITTIRINGTDLGSVSNYDWHRVWPPEMEAASGNNVNAVSIKSTGTPIAQGQSITIQVLTAQGYNASQNFTCSEPQLRIGCVIPSQDLTKLYVYLRNEDSVNWTVNNLHWDGVDYAAGTAPELAAVGGSWVVAPNCVKILTLTSSTPFALDQSIVGVQATPSGGSATWVSAPMHLTDPLFGIGTWSSSMASDEGGMRYAKKLQIDTVMGPGNMTEIASMWDRYSIKALRGAGSIGSFDFAFVQNNADNEAIRMWYVDDEPDLGGDPVSEVLELNQNYWKNDPNHPTICTYAQSEKFGRYAPIPSITSMDHYAAYSAPNCIPNTWVFRKAYLDEAMDYTWCLKENTEPISNWAWIQMCADGTWDTQPKVWAQNYQWWTQIMMGLKGVLWFKYGPGYENDSDVDENVAEGMQMTRELSQVRNLVLYSEMQDTVTRSTTEVKSRMLVGEEAVVVVVANDNYSIGGFAWSPSYSISQQSFNVTVTIPDWISIDQVYRVSQNGKETVNYSINGRDITISETVYKDSFVYVIGANDTTAPEKPTRLVKAAYTDNQNFVLSWLEPYDNFGVKGYKVYRNGLEVADVRYAMYEAVGVAPGGIYKICAYDSSGNLSDPAFITIDPEGGLTGEYFSGTTLSNFAMVRRDPVIDFDWGTGSPHPNVPTDGFSVRWSGVITPQFSETYTFYATSDDGVRLWVNGQQLIDAWLDQPPTEYSGNIALTAGVPVPIVIEYYEGTGGCSIKLEWASASLARELVPATRMDQTRGLTGDYYNSTSFTNFALSRRDDEIDFDWGTGSPDPVVNTDNFSVRWSGLVIPNFSETYEFITTTDDGVRLWVGGQQLINDWTGHPATENSGTVSLTQGVATDIVMEYFEATGEASAKLEWLSDSQDREVVPQSNLLEQTGPTNTPTNTPTSTNTPTATDTPTATSTPTNTEVGQPTNTFTPTATNTNTPTVTATATNTATSTNTPTATATNTPTATPTSKGDCGSAPMYRSPEEASQASAAGSASRALVPLVPGLMAIGVWFLRRRYMK